MDSAERVKYKYHNRNSSQQIYGDEGSKLQEFGAWGLISFSLI